MVGLADTMKYCITKSRYKKGKIGKEEFDKIKDVIDEEYRYGQMTMLSKKIRGMNKVNYDPKRDVSSLYDRDE